MANSQSTKFVATVTSSKRVTKLSHIETRLGFSDMSNVPVEFIKDELPLDQQDTTDISEVETPPFITDLIKRRVASNNIKQTAPAPGQIRELTMHGVPCILYICLKDIATDPETGIESWFGWMCSGDQEYASWYDFLVTEEEGPIEPNANMIQVWNPMQVRPLALGKVVGILSAESLKAVNSLAVDFMFSDPPKSVKPESGILTRMTTGGHMVTTGTPKIPCGSIDQYQELYYEAKVKFRETSI